MVGRKKSKKDDPQAKAAPRKAGYRDWDNIVPGEPMAPQPYADQSYQSPQPAYPAQPQPQAPPAAVPHQQPYQQPVAQPNYPQQPAQPQQPPQPAYQQPAQPQPGYQQPMPGAAGAPGGPGAAPAPAAGVNPTDGNCTKCGATFGQKAVCEGCGAGRTACLVCGTKIWAGALTCSAHSNAMRR